MRELILNKNITKTENGYCVEYSPDNEELRDQAAHGKDFDLGVDIEMVSEAYKPIAAAEIIKALNLSGEYEFQISQFQQDRAKYLKRAENKDILIAEMDAENIGRVKSGVWTSSQLISLTQDPQLMAIINDINTLSFEIAAQKIPAITNVLITNEIKTAWVAKLQLYF